jgi:phage tail sheath protein FI
MHCLRELEARGDMVRGAPPGNEGRPTPPKWKYVSVERVALFLESSIQESTRWAVFEPDGEELWGQIRLEVGAFMQTLFLQGAFQGATASQAFFVTCDSDNNPQSSIDEGVVNILVGFAPVLPAEFVTVQISQMTGQTAPGGGD